jgi:hypothetical protein
MKINFACSNCMEIFDVDMISIEYDQQNDLLFNPIPECTFCGATEEVYLSNKGQMQIEKMMMLKQIKKAKTGQSSDGKS